MKPTHYPKSFRLLKRHQFIRICRHSKRYVGECVVIDANWNRVSRPRLGITVTKKFGPSHSRNRFKRIVREAFRLRSGVLPPLDIHVKPRALAVKASMHDIMRDFAALGVI